MSLEELDDEESSYVQLDRLKRDHLITWKKLCRLRQISTKIGRFISRQRFVYNGKRFLFSHVETQLENLCMLV